MLAHPGSAGIRFRSTGVSWITSTNPYSGIARVYLDGRRVTDVDLYSSTTRYQQVVYEVSGLRYGVHRLKIVRSGRKNERSVGRGVTVDAIHVPDATAPLRPTRLASLVTPRGSVLSWAASTSTDVAGYAVYRQVGHQPRALLGMTPATTTQLLDDDLADRTAYRYELVAFDRAGNVSATSTTGFDSVAAATPGYSRYTDCPGATVTVSSRDELLDALAGAGPGTVIRVASGRYWGTTTVTVRGTDADPVWVCGSRDAVFDQGNDSVGVGLRIVSSSHLVIAGMTVRNTAKGVVVIGSDHVTVADLKIEDIGEEAVHLQRTTTDSTVVANTITNTGLVHPQYGEGVYLGTDKQNWCRYNDCQPDHTSRNAIVGNTISATTAEGIEAKEATADTLVAGNSVDGSATTLTTASGALIKIKGNHFVVRDNTLANSTQDAVLVLRTLADTGQDDVVFRNRFRGQIPGYGVRVSSRKVDVVIGCDNTGPTGRGLSNHPCNI